MSENQNIRPTSEKFLNDPTDDQFPYGTKKYHRTEFTWVGDCRNSTIGSFYKAGKPSTLVYAAKMDKDALSFYHCCVTLCNFSSCALCHTSTLSKYSFVHVYDDHVEINIASSECCWIMDNTRVFYLDRDWAQGFSSVNICCAGAVIASGEVNGVCCAGGRRILPPPKNERCCAMLRNCHIPLQRSPCGGCEPLAFCPCSRDSVHMPFVKDTGKLIEALNSVRKNLVTQYAIVPGKPIDWTVQDSHMSRA